MAAVDSPAQWPLAYAFEWLERAYFLRDSGIPLARVTRFLESLHADPRWPRFLHRVGPEG